MAEQRHKELRGQRCADAAGRFARLLIRIMQDGQEIEATSTERQPVKPSQFQFAARVHADEEDVGVGRMERNEIANVCFEAANLFAARIERMDQADLVTRFDPVGISRAQRQGQC